MNVPLSSLEELSKQRKIKLLVEKDGLSHKYFKRMAEIEKEMFDVYKETVLLPDENTKEFETWDYPVKYMYQDLNDAINSIPQIDDLDEIFKMVKTSTIAFAHDSAQIEYEMSKNCNLTTIGEVFARQPLAVAVQSGSKLKEELSEAMFVLQESHLFELLASKYWNFSNTRKCHQLEEDQAISFHSLEGVFVVVAGAMVLSFGLIIHEICNRRNKVGPIDDVTPIVAVDVHSDVNRKIKQVLAKIN